METEFEWDARKAASNLAKHGVSFEEAATVFDDDLARIFEDQYPMGWRSANVARSFFQILLQDHGSFFQIACCVNDIA